MPGQPKLWLSYGGALRCAGRRDDSLQAIRTCLRLAPSTGRAWWDLANLKTEILTQDDTEAMRAYLAAPDISEQDRIYLHYALGHAEAQRAAHEDSFAHYAAGAALKRAVTDYDPDAFRAQVRATTDLFTPAFFAPRQGAGLPDPAPIFIVGLPRTGSTLVEQILASHSAVEGTTELSAIGNIARDLARQSDEPAYPQCLTALSPAELADLGRRYLDRARIYRKTERPRFIDKMPANWEHVGLIHLILPRAKIIDMRRDPMASCFAAFKQYFDAGAAFSYDLEELGRYYNDYAETMAHFDRVLPGRIHRVTYETLVTDTEAEIRRLLAYCGLAFEPACLRFWETRRQVATASSEQVRQPIFRAGLDEWRHYERWLGPLKEVLLF
jgi:tetratricopeptide (TPR) repeat protein